LNYLKALPPRMKVKRKVKKGISGKNLYDFLKKKVNTLHIHGRIPVGKDSQSPL